MPAPIEDRVAVVLANSVDVHMLVDEPHMISGNGDHALDEVLLGIHGIAKDDDVLPLDTVVGHQPVPQSRMSVVRLVDQQVIADQQGLLHRLGRYLERLHNKRNHEDRDHDGAGQRLERVQAGGSGSGCAPRERPAAVGQGCVDFGLGARFTHEGSGEQEVRSRVLQP